VLQQMGLLVASTRMIPVELSSAVEILYSMGFELIDINYANVERSEIDYPSVANIMRLSLLTAVKLGAKPVTLHAPWEDYFIVYLGKGLEHAIGEAKIFLEIAGSYGVEVVVFHGFSSKRVGSYRAEWLNKRFFAELAEYAEKEGLPVVAVENSSGAKP
jgi:sugar phosphate isomerase/epimerase